MTNYLRKIAPRCEPPGLETELLRRMPAILVLGSCLPLVVHALASLRMAGKGLLSIDIFLVAAVITFWTAGVTVTIACI